MMVPTNPNILETMRIGRFPHFREKAETNGPEAAVTRSMYPEITVMSATPTLKSNAIVTRAGESRGARTAA